MQETDTTQQTIYFPKDYNDEQIAIAEKARRNNKVLVQGPPGTGKSHTIANLICHLLAHGNKVLVTAYTPRALEVLKGKLPKNFQDLTVNLLGGDSSSIQGLDKNVNTISSEASQANLPERKHDIEELEKKLSDARENKAFNFNELVYIKEQSIRIREVNAFYKGTLLEISEQLESDTDTFTWYTDSFADIENTTAENQGNGALAK